MKNKETLEEAAETYASKIWDCSDSNEKTLYTNCKKAFEKGAKWQQEQDKSKYSEEDMRKSFMAGIKCESNNGKNFEQFIKQFKIN